MRFEIGDVVKVKGLNNIMVIEGFKTDTVYYNCICIWFDEDNRLCKEIFLDDILMKVKE